MATNDLKSTNRDHYLTLELDKLAAADSMLWGFIQRASLDGVWYWDLQNPEHLYISPEYWHCLGIDPETRAHTPDEFIDVVFPEDLPNVLKNLDEHYADPSVPYEQTVRFRHADGSTVWVRCRGLAIRDAQGKAIRMLGAHNNITQAKEAELIAVKQAKLLAQAYDELKQLTYRVSHDLTAPINTIEMLMQEVKSDPNNPLSSDQLHLCGIAQRTTQRTKQTLSDLLHFSRSLHEPVSPTTVDLNKTAQQALDNLASLIADAQAKITIADLPHVQGDENQLLSLIQNLLSNAIKYRDRDRDCIVQLEHSTSDHQLNLVVTDNGIGMTVQDATRIFRPFERLHDHDTVPGTGLGLAVCDRIARHHGGRISVKSQLGKGTQFTIHLSGYRP